MRNIPVTYHYDSLVALYASSYENLFETFILKNTLYLTIWSKTDWEEYIFDLTTLKLIRIPFSIEVSYFSNDRNWESVILFIKRNIYKIISMEVNQKSSLVINFNDGTNKIFESY